ncbi:MAG: PIN domain-containing protein [Sediminibacterium magnilacihabitans]|nr:PIN domain-containing protein [Sediminibacterium magnilacihabitans]PQV62375.1 PIN domain-containing protein [Sediminibacterium magnilacihabitans]
MQAGTIKMGKIVKISAKNSLTTVRKALKDLHLTMAAENARNKKPKTLADFYGSLPDALIAATAIHNNLPLLTADTGFTRIKELNIVLIEL